MPVNAVKPTQFALFTWNLQCIDRVQRGHDCPFKWDSMLPKLWSRFQNRRQGRLRERAAEAISVRWMLVIQTSRVGLWVVATRRVGEANWWYHLLAVGSAWKWQRYAAVREVDKSEMRPEENEVMTQE